MGAYWFLTLDLSLICFTLQFFLDVTTRCSRFKRIRQIIDAYWLFHDIPLLPTGENIDSYSNLRYRHSQWGDEKLFWCGLGFYFIDFFTSHSSNRAAYQTTPRRCGWVGSENCGPYVHFPLGIFVQNTIISSWDNEFIRWLISPRLRVSATALLKPWIFPGG